MENLSSVWTPEIDKKNSAKVFYNRGIFEYRNVPQNSIMSVFTVYGGLVGEYNLNQSNGTFEADLERGVYIAVVEGYGEKAAFKICAN